MPPSPQSSVPPFIASLAKVLVRRQDIITFWAIVGVSVVSIAAFAALLIVVLL